MPPTPCVTAPCPAIEDIDRQHGRLAELLNRFEDAYHQQAPIFVLQGVVSDLIAFSELHLRDQGRLIPELVPPAFEQHLYGDRQLLLNLLDLQQALALGRGHLSGEALHAFLAFFLHRVRSSCPSLAMPRPVPALPLGPSGAAAPPRLFSSAR